ncbi:uncharacterized protein LOC129871716 isoform X2 [Solanum dulcamara]|uniref:uncharacterized protein LOC129871716 isoform X2 n=1 Tax=Solanum dulcamara TaxID=45834 RepID=UPI0024864FF9|nr:uncharacterized protein LOC129871716 isoform X2 [Solanum dulcamara]
MDLFIWGPPYFQDENSFPGNSLAQNFYFSQKLDIIEEDALNEKCCVQVLEILIAKADTEIAELEDDIVMLQSQLARTNENWLDMCIAALNKKIDRLGSLITTLKNKNVQASGVHLQTNRKPSERIHEILETSLRNFSSPRGKQPADSTLGSSKLAAAVLIKVEAIDDHDLKVIETVETNGSSTVQANVMVQTPFVVQERNHQETDEHSITKDSSTKASGHASDKSTLKDLNESDIPGKLINASKRDNPSHLNNFACAVLKSARTKPSRDKAQFCGASKRKINVSEDFLEDELMQQSSNEGIIINSSPGVKETSIGEGPKPPGAIVMTRPSAVKQEPKGSGDEQTQNGGKAGQTRVKHTLSQLVSQKQTGTKKILGIKGKGLLTETGHTLEDSLVVLLNPKKKDGSKQLEIFKGELRVKQPPKSQVLTIHKSNSKLSQKLEGQRLNFKWNVPTEMAKELCLAEELGFKSPSGLKLKRQLKTESTKENGGDEFRDKPIKESLSPLGGAKGTGDLPEISSTCLIHLKKRRITSSTGPILQENENLRDFQNRLVKSQDRSNQNLQVIKAENAELLDSTTSIALIPNITDLKYMTMNQLKAVAREQKLHGVYKLRKAELQESLRELLAKGRST